MNKNNRSRNAAAGVKAPGPHPMNLQDFDELAASQAVQVEHQSIPGFLRRIPYKWHMNDINRYGSEVGRTADAMQLVFMTAVDKSLGVLRVFPLPLLERVYTLMSPQFGWPAIINGEALADGRTTQRETLRKNERTAALLQELTERADNVELLTAANQVCEFLKSETEKLQGELT